MSRFGRHFVRTRDIKDFERRLIRLVVDKPGALHPHDEALFRYAAVMARMHLMRSPEGHDVPVAEDVDGLRRWMLESIIPLVPGGGKSPDLEMLRQLSSVLAVRVASTRDALLERHVNAFGAQHLDDEIRHKKLALALGGGGGAGLMHLGTFAMFHDMGVIPELLVGSSMGATMGAVRALQRDYDPVAAALAFPKDVDYGSLFKPFTGYSRFGFPGAFHVNLLRISREIVRKLTGQSALTFEDVPLKLQVVVTGIRKGFQLDERDYAKQASVASSMRSKLQMFFKAVRQISQNPRLLAQLVFGKDEDTLNFSVVEAIGFSCAVPGLLHYDIYHDDPDVIGPLERIFERHNLLRLCDGGVINNVPSQVAWDSVQQGTLGTRNAFIMGCDVFAPLSTGRNLVWIPVQQIARGGVTSNKAYSDYHKTFHDPPSPLQLLVNQYSRLKAIVSSARRELEADAPYIRRALAPLPPFGVWEHER